MNEPVRAVASADRTDGSRAASAGAHGRAVPMANLYPQREDDKAIAEVEPAP